MIPSRRACFLFVLVALCMHVPRATAATDWDPVSDADKALTASPLDPGAGAVVLFKRGNIDVVEKSSLFWTTRIQTYVRIKVFNDAGRDAANVAVQHTKNVRLSKIEGHTIQPSGEVIPLDSSKVFQGIAYKEGHFAMLQTSFTLPAVQPGSILEYQIEEYEDWFFPDPWVFDTAGFGTLDSTLRVTVGPRLDMAQFPLESTLNHISVSQSETVTGSQVNFSIKNLRPIQDEPYALPFRDQATMVLFTPTQLGFSGEVFPIIAKWDDVGQVVTRDLDNMQKSEKEMRNKAKELTDKISDPQKKAEAIYSYLQQNITSTDAIGVGFGRPADDILSNKRGDPDEINALYVLMLREAKIDANLILVATKNWETLIRAFPNRNQFARAITRVNLKQGAIFTDPGDAAAPFGELPWFERGVLAFAVKGSKVQETPIPDGSPDDNVSTAKSTMQVGKDWSFEGDQELWIKGEEAIDYRAELMDQSPQKLDQTLTELFSYGHADADVTKIEHPDFRDSSQPFLLKAHVKEHLDGDGGGNAGLLLNPWLGDQYERPVFRSNARHSAVRFHAPEKRVMTTTWVLAPEIKVDQLPKEVKVDNDLGGFAHSCTQNGSTVTCTRTYYLKKMLLQTSADYLNAKKFFDDVAKEDQEVIVLRQ